MNIAFLAIFVPLSYLIILINDYNKFTVAASSSGKAPNVGFIVLVSSLLFFLLFLYFVLNIHWELTDVGFEGVVGCVSYNIKQQPPRKKELEKGFNRVAPVAQQQLTPLRKIEPQKRPPRRVQEEQEEEEFCLKTYSYYYITKMTKNFRPSYLLGEGGFARVYKGYRTNGTVVAIKKLERREGRIIDDFKNEVQALGQTSHFNLVKLIGYCVEGEHRLLVYEYMSNGTLQQWISGDDPRKLLSWVEKKNIIKGIAKGLVYLHENCKNKIIHLDLKPLNILLDGNKNAKLGDFGLSRILERDQSSASAACCGTRGYMAPEIMKRGKVSEKVDVYSFGVVVLEIVFGKKHRPNQSYLEEDQLPGLIGKFGDEMKEILLFRKLALSCLSDEPKDRPKMSDVLYAIKGFDTFLPCFRGSLLGMIIALDPTRTR